MENILKTYVQALEINIHPLDLVVLMVKIGIIREVTKIESIRENKIPTRKNVNRFLFL